MKPKTIQINQTPEQPQGFPIEVVEPESAFEEKLLGHLLTMVLREGRQSPRIAALKIPEAFTVEYSGTEGRFLVNAQGSVGKGQPYYQPERAQGVLALRCIQNRFELIFGTLTANQPAPVPAPPSAGK